MFGLLAALRSEPVRSPADEVGGKGGELLSQPERRRRAHLEMMHLEDTLAFFDARFNGLPAIVGGEPGGQVGGDPVAAEVHLAAMAQGRAGSEPFQSQIDRVRTSGQVLRGPGHHVGIGADPYPGGGGVTRCTKWLASPS